MENNALKRRLLGSKKTERIIFAATPQTKAALEALARDRCISVSALITQLAVDEALKYPQLIEEGELADGK